jgi:hypothetical protein
MDAPGDSAKKHHPQRMCIGCRQSRDRWDLIRLVCTADGRVEVDPTHKRNSRGAYLCPVPACWHTALKRRSIERALRLDKVHPDDKRILTQIAQNLEEATVNME